MMSKDLLCVCVCVCVSLCACVCVSVCLCVCVCVFQVGQAQDLSLTNQLIDYLMGESDGMPKVHAKDRTTTVTTNPHSVITNPNSVITNPNSVQTNPNAV